MTPRGGTPTPTPDTQTRNTLADDIDRLANTWVHVEITDEGKRHITRHPSLLTQLRHAIHHPDTSDDGPSARSIPESRPPCSEEPLHVLLTAERSVRAILTIHGIKPRGRLEDDLGALVGAPLTGRDLEDAAVAVHGLRTQAEQLLGWAPRSIRPRIRCPECNRNGSIAIRMDTHGPRDARCSACGTYWPREHLGLLAGAV